MLYRLNNGLMAIDRWIYDPTEDPIIPEQHEPLIVV